MMGRKKHTDPVDLTKENLAHAIRDLLQVAAGWENGLFAESGDDRLNHHEQLLRAVATLVWDHWGSERVATVDKAAIRTSDIAFLRLWSCVASELRNYEILLAETLQRIDDNDAGLAQEIRSLIDKTTNQAAIEFVTDELRDGIISAIHSWFLATGYAVPKSELEELWCTYEQLERETSQSWIRAKRGATDAALALLCDLTGIGGRRMRSAKKAPTHLASAEIVAPAIPVSVGDELRSDLHIPSDIMESYALKLLGCTTELTESVLHELDKTPSQPSLAWLNRASSLERSPLSRPHPHSAVLDPIPYVTDTNGLPLAWIAQAADSELFIARDAKTGDILATGLSRNKVLEEAKVLVCGND